MLEPIDDADAPQRPSVDAIRRHIEEGILKGRYAPGSRLPEQALAESLGVSRGPLREAIRTLEGRRLLERIPNAGVRVVELSIDDVDQILTLRESLEGMASRLAAENMTLAEVRQLRHVTLGLQRLDHPTTEAVFHVDADQDFHHRIVLGSRNKWISNLLCHDFYTLIRLCRIQSGKLRQDRPGIHEEHHAIVDCIERRDGEGAEQAMRAHVRQSRDRLLAEIQASRP